MKCNDKWMRQQIKEEFNRTHYTCILEDRILVLLDEREKELRELLKKGKEALKYHEETTKSDRDISFWRGWNLVIRREILGKLNELEKRQKELGE